MDSPSSFMNHERQMYILFKHAPIILSHQPESVIVLASISLWAFPTCKSNSSGRIPYKSYFCDFSSNFGYFNIFPIDVVILIHRNLHQLGLSQDQSENYGFAIESTRPFGLCF